MTTTISPPPEDWFALVFGSPEPLPTELDRFGDAAPEPEDYSDDEPDDEPDCEAIWEARYERRAEQMEDWDDDFWR